MGIIKIFFFLPSKGKFLQAFGDNDQMKAKADMVWRQLETWSPVLLILAAVIGIGLAVYYYTLYNEMPGRHYRISHWLRWAGCAFISSLVVTAGIEYFGINTNIGNHVTSLYTLCALNNALYCLILYFLTSLVWCNFCRTNAYRFLKL